MDKDLHDKLRADQHEGNKASMVYEAWVKPFVEAKKQVLFEAFVDVSISNVNDLQEIKRMMNTLDSFANEIRTFIDTGKMASSTLSEHNKLHEETH